MKKQSKCLIRNMPGSLFRNRRKYMHCYTLSVIGTLQPSQTRQQLNSKKTMMYTVINWQNWLQWLTKLKHC